MYPLALLAGGLATRLRPITEKIPKSLVVVASQPFIFWQLRYLKQQGVDQIVICTGHLGHLIEQVVGDGSTFGLQVRYSSDGPTLLGTGGAIRNALPLLGEKFFVLYGDSFLPINFLALKNFYDSNQPDALMTVMRNQDRWDRSNVVFQDGILKEYNKQLSKPQMTHIDYGLSILSATVFDAHSGAFSFDLADFYGKLILEGRLAGYEVFERFYEIGSHHGLRETEDFLMKQDLP